MIRIAIRFLPNIVIIILRIERRFEWLKKNIGRELGVYDEAIHTLFHAL